MLLLQTVLQAGLKGVKIAFSFGFLLLQTVLQAGLKSLKIVLQANFESLDVALIRRLQLLEIALGGQALVEHKEMFNGEDFGLGLGHAHPGQALNQIVSVEGGGLHAH